MIIGLTMFHQPLQKRLDGGLITECKKILKHFPSISLQRYLEAKIDLICENGVDKLKIIFEERKIEN